MVTYNILIQMTLKNIFINVFNEKGQTVIFLTAGQLGFDGKQKKTPIALQFILYKLVKSLKKKKINSVNLFFKNAIKVNKKIIIFLQNANLKIKMLNDCTEIIHNGCRRSRRKRK